MTQYTRSDGATGFADLDDTVCTPSVATKLDTLINGMIAAYNAIDNTNIATSPKIAASKVDLSTGGYVPLDGSVDMSGMLVQAFDSIWRTMRASGNARLREYRGADGALWGVSYNTYYNGSAWVGRDVTDICAVIKMESSGLHYYHAVSAAAGVAPTWTELFHVNTSGVINVGVPKADTLTEAMINWASGGAIGNTMINGLELSDATGSSSFVTVATVKIYIPANATTLTYYGEGKYTGGTAGDFRLTVASANGSPLTGTITTYSLLGPGTLNISAESGWTTVNIQISTASSSTGYCRNITGSFS